jgi:3-phenylpropionate/trans-cinnamate dioxygenase ferredoxin reductase subunit
LRENGWTGPITLVGGEAELPYERPPLSKTWAHKPICDDERLRAADVTYLPGTHATALDPHAHAVTLDDGRTLAYAKLLLATGATARPPAVRRRAGAPRPHARRRPDPAHPPPRGHPQSGSSAAGSSGWSWPPPRRRRSARTSPCWSSPTG